MNDLAHRLASLEERVRSLEEALRRGRDAGTDRQAAPTPTASAAPPPQPPRPVVPPDPARPDAGATPATTPPTPSGPEEPRLTLATSVLGLGGATALVIAAMYLIQLAIDSGWLTPERQIALAALGGIALIGAGLALARLNRSYAALLPGAGVVVLFLTVFGAHIYHGLISAPLATAGVAVVCLVSLWLGHVFSNDMYVLFAVVGAYSTPFLLSPAERPDLEDLLIYFSAWSVLFCVQAVWTASRSAYLVAMYLAVVGFDLIWRDAGQPAWATAAIYQALQFLIFSVTAMVYSVRRRTPMSQAEAYTHLPALLIFYALEYSILREHLPGWAPWIAFASLVFLLGGHLLLAKRMMRESPAGSRSILGAYAVLVVLHAGYVELLPDRLTPWIGIAILPLFVLGRRWLGSDLGGAIARVGMGGVFALNYLRVLSEIGMTQVPAGGLLRWLYPIVLYVGYGLTRPEASRLGIRMPLLYAAHVAAMVAVAQFVDTSFMTSVLWGVIAVAGLVVALQLRDRTLGQSSFLVFAVSGLKVLLYDLADAAPLVRIGSLVALGVSLFVGGWLYQALSGSETRRQAD